MTPTAGHAAPAEDVPGDAAPDGAARAENAIAVADAGTAVVPDADTSADTGEGGTRAKADADVEAGDPGKPAPYYARLEDFVDGHFLPLIRRPLGGEFRWCAQWWQHAEAISRLTALWHAWEALRRQPGTGIGIWYRDHLDHQLPMLLGPRGPFFQCSEAEHIEPRRLRSEPAPPDWWPDQPAAGHA